MKLGVDIVSVGKFRKIKKADFEHWKKIFNDTEWKYSFSDKNSAEHLAGIFASKEAAMKASGKAGYKHLSDWKVTRDSSGAPKISGFKKTGKALLSISHSGGVAIAVVLIL